MFQISQNESVGLGRAATGALAAWVVMGGSGSLLWSDADRLPAAGCERDAQPAGRGHRPFRDAYRQGIVQPVRLRPVRVDLRDVASPGGQERERHVERAALLVGDGA